MCIDAFHPLSFNVQFICSFSTCYLLSECGIESFLLLCKFCKSWLEVIAWQTYTNCEFCLHELRKICPGIAHVILKRTSIYHPISQSLKINQSVIHTVCHKCFLLVWPVYIILGIFCYYEICHTNFDVFFIDSID